MKFKGQGKLNICGFEYKKNIADSRRGGGGVPSTQKKNLYPRLGLVCFLKTLWPRIIEGVGGALVNRKALLVTQEFEAWTGLAGLAPSFHCFPVLYIWISLGRSNNVCDWQTLLDMSKQKDPLPLGMKSRTWEDQGENRFQASSCRSE